MSTPNNLLQLQGATKSFGTKVLFTNATFSVNEGEHIGVIGPNGAGKTSLFKVFAGELDLDDGEAVRSRQLSLGYLRQHDTWNEADTLEDYLSANERTPLWEMKKWGRGLGLSDEQFYSPIKSLSGGYRMRAKLLHLLGEQPNLMMLDEPTNYLDLETLLVLEEFLQDFEGAFLLISHDREFLKRTTDHILEIESGDLIKFSGNIDDYFEQKEMLRGQLEKRAMSAAARKKEVLDFAARFGAKASKARQVQSRLKQMNKMESIELKPLPISAKIRIPPPTHTGKVALEVKDADFGYSEENSILHRVNLKIESGDHLGVVGFNGAGKSTFLKSIAKELEPLHGEVEWGYQVTLGYYAQHVAERLNPEKTVLEELSDNAHTDVRQQEILDLAGSLLFSGDHVKKKIKILSGGEKARVALGQILLKKAPLLLLDEPTNHLDFYTVESLTQALEKYAGTVVIVSHDRGFVRRIATKILEVKSGRIQLYPGTYDEYVWSVQQRQLNPDAEKSEPEQRVTRKKKEESEAPIPAPSKIVTAAPAYLREQKKELETRKRALDKTLQDIDRKTKILESRMAEQGAKLETAKDNEAAALARELSAAQRKIQEFEKEFLNAMTEREEILLRITELDGH
ncbi:MAG: transporter ATP-binding protein [Bacteriovoracaceae bacterium]|nr:transporter ATP-binding protein [Bacteriovoracaceae bacterium]